MSSLDEYIEKLGCPDEAERTYAAEDIEYLNTAEGVPPLLERLTVETSRAVRDAIFQALIRIEADAAIEGCILLFDSDDPQIRNQAVDVLRHKGAGSIPFLNGVMRGETTKTKGNSSLMYSGGIQVDGAGEIYAAALGDADPNVVMTAVEKSGPDARKEEFRGPNRRVVASRLPPHAGRGLSGSPGGDRTRISLKAIRRRFPDFGDAAGLLSGLMLGKRLPPSDQLGSSEVASLLPVRAPHLRPADASALLGIYPRCQPLEPSANSVTGPAGLVNNGDSPLCRYQALRVLGLWAKS